MEPLIHERDRYLAYQLRICCQRLAATVHAPVVVAVVGMGHVRGIQENFARQVDEEDLRRISEPPAPRPPLFTTTRVVFALTLCAAAVFTYRRYVRR
jgi:pheromone shutdown protein TraB